jgi:hypothetical protein
MDDYALWGTKPGKFNSSADGDIIDCYLVTELCFAKIKSTCEINNIQTTPCNMLHG